MSGQDVSALLAEFGHGEEDARDIAEAARRTDLEVQDLVSVLCFTDCQTSVVNGHAWRQKAESKARHFVCRNVETAIQTRAGRHGRPKP
jgi:hypothetical protein